LVEILVEINQQDTPSSFVRHTPEMTIAQEMDDANSKLEVGNELVYDTL
jgi:hypothetical protein